MRSAIRCRRIPDGIFIISRKKIQNLSISCAIFFYHITNQLISYLNIIEILKTDTTLISFTDFSYILFLMTQRAQVAFIENISAAIETDFGITSQFTIG